MSNPGRLVRRPGLFQEALKMVRPLGDVLAVEVQDHAGIAVPQEGLHGGHARPVVQEVRCQRVPRPVAVDAKGELAGALQSLEAAIHGILLPRLALVVAEHRPLRIGVGQASEDARRAGRKLDLAAVLFARYLPFVEDDRSAGQQQGLELHEGPLAGKSRTLSHLRVGITSGAGPNEPATTNNERSALRHGTAAGTNIVHINVLTKRAEQCYFDIHPKK